MQQEDGATRIGKFVLRTKDQKLGLVLACRPSAIGDEGTDHSDDKPIDKMAIV
jgi:hypothetical protein